MVFWKLRESYRSIPNGMFVLLVCAFVLVAYLLTSGEGAAARLEKEKLLHV